MIINIMAGGPAETLPNFKVFDHADCIWAGVDKGVLTLLEAGIQPDIGIGDFDSVSDKEWNKIQNSGIKLLKAKSEKDETDLEMAVNWAISKQPEQIHLYGATGGRIDHFLGNLQLLLKPVLEGIDIPIFIEDKQNFLFAAGPGNHAAAKMEGYKYISFVPITPTVEGLSLQGFKYPLDDTALSFGSTLCISNEFEKDTGHFSFTKGILMVVRSKD